MDRLRMLIPAMAALALAVAGCQLGEVTADAEADADAIAAAVTSQSDGLAQEVMDVGAYLFGSAGGSTSVLDQRSYAFAVPHVRFFSGDLVNFVWDEATKTHLRTRTDFNVLLPDHAIYVDSLLVKVQFYTSTDASGEGYGPIDFSDGFDPEIHSMTYHREISATTANLETGTVNVHAAESDLAFTDIDAEAGTVTLNGARTRAFDRAFPNGRSVVGTIDDEVSDLLLTWDAESGTVAWSGTLAYVIDATVTRPDGTQVQRHREGTIEFSGSSTFTVTVDGIAYTYRLSDGTRVE